MKEMEKLRFAPLIRCSTEKQEKQGESLNTQTNHINQYVNFLHGMIPDNCWYVGQEHATSGYERQILEKLLSDSGKNLFDAVIVNDPSRWSRDNLKSKEGLNILKSNGIRFFVGTVEYDLFNPTQNLFLGMSAEMNEYQAKQQQLRSIESRISRAKKNMPSTGKIPFGRLYDKKTETWSVDPLKQSLIQEAATRYLAGESVQNIASTFNMNAPNLHKILHKRSGTQWLCSFVHPELNINEKILVTIPALLDEDTIRAIHDKAKANRTYLHGQIKHHYLLSRMIFCADCGYTSFGYTNHTGKRYYRHANYRNLNHKYSKFINADEIENAVLLHLIKTFGDITRINEAIKKATPDLSKIDLLIQEKEKLRNELKKITQQKDKIVDAIADDIITKEDAKSKLDKLNERNTSILSRISAIENELGNIPDPNKVKRLTKFGINILRDVTQNPKLIFSESYKWKRNLIEHAFSGF